MKNTTLTLLFSTLFFSSALYAHCNNRLDEVLVDTTCTKIKTFKSQKITQNPMLVVVLHGDSPHKNPVYQYEFAEKVAKNNSNTIAIGVLRPGYSDGMGRTSDGEKGLTNGDNYDAKRVQQLAQVIMALQQIYTPVHTIVVGHSGGAAIIANINSLYPLLMEHAVLVACPCDVKSWRKDMFKLSKKPIFDGELTTLSPMDLVHKLNKHTTISMFVGEQDKITPVYLNQAYKDAANHKGIEVSLKILQGQHNIFLNPDILAAIDDIIMAAQVF